MRALTRLLMGAILLLFMAAIAAAQTGAAVTGVVADTSGAVLPGVTVEAKSPALIEQLRSAVTDEGGRYRIVDLRPGIYTVTSPYLDSQPSRAMALSFRGPSSRQ